MTNIKHAIDEDEYTTTSSTKVSAGDRGRKCKIIVKTVILFISTSVQLGWYDYSRRMQCQSVLSFTATLKEGKGKRGNRHPCAVI